MFLQVRAKANVLAGQLKPVKTQMRLRHVRSRRDGLVPGRGTVSVQGAETAHRQHFCSRQERLRFSFHIRSGIDQKHHRNGP